MKKLVNFLCLCLAAVSMVSCYDDTEIWESLKEFQDRILKLETLCNKMNENITSLQQILAAAENGDAILSVTPMTQDGKEIGYVIEFEKAGKVYIYHGQDGQDGADGQDGSNGKDGYTPVVGIQQDTDGIYYWTLDNEWLLDADGNKIKAQGTDGKDGADGEDGADGKDGKDAVAPKLEIREGYWYISYDDGVSWTQLGKAVGDDGADGQDGDSLFSSVTSDGDYVYFELSSGTVLTIPMSSDSMEEELQNNKIYYTTTDGKKMFPNNTNPGIFGAILTSNTYENGQGVLTFDDDVIAVGSTAFYNTCTTLETIKLPSTVKEVGYYAFNGCTSLKSVYFASAQVPAATSSNGKWAPFDLNATGRKIYVPEDAVDKYRSAAWWDRYASSITFANDSSDVESPAKVSEFRYTTSDGKAISASAFNLPLVRNEYDASAGAFVMIFEGEITEIPASAFSRSSTLTSISIPDGVTSIGEYAFNYCESLQGVTLPEGLTSIGERAFFTCKSLYSITLPEGLETIGKYAFHDCGGISSINIPGTVRSIGEKAFEWCLVSEVHIDDLSDWLDIEFGSAASNPLFKDDSNTKDCVLYVDGEIVTDLVIPDGVTEIKNYAFAGAVLSSVTLPDSVVSIGDYAFYLCGSIQNVSLSPDLTTIGDGAFCSCAAMGNVTLPETVVTIGERAFYGCSSLTELTIPDSVKSIGQDAFDQCLGVIVLNLGNGVESIGSSAFWRLALKEIHIKDLSAWFRIDFGDITANPIYGGRNLYLNDQLITELVIPADITEIKPYAFAWSQTVSSLVITDNVTRISYDAFARCDNLESVTFGKGLVYIEEQTFNNLEKIKVVNITDLPAWCRIEFENSSSNPLANRDAELYLNGEKVTDLVIPTGVTEVKSYSFVNIDLTTLVIPEGVVSIGEYAFKGVLSGDGLESVTLPSTLTSIGAGAFGTSNKDCNVYISDLSQWMNMSFGDSQSVPAGYYYLNGTEITEVNIPEGTTQIKPYIFSNCKSLAKVTLPSTLVSIGNGAFASCYSLSDVTLNDGLDTVGESVFAGCAMTELTLPATVTFLDYGAFGSSSLQTVNVLSPVPCGMGSHTAGGGIYESKTTYGQFSNNANIYVPAESVVEYKVAEGWSELADKIFAKE